MLGRWRFSKMVQLGATWRELLQSGAKWRNLLQAGANWCKTRNGFGRAGDWSGAVLVHGVFSISTWRDGLRPRPSYMVNFDFGWRHRLRVGCGWLIGNGLEALEKFRLCGSS
jgi:hypothetical protein